MDQSAVVAILHVLACHGLSCRLVVIFASRMVVPLPRAPFETHKIRKQWQPLPYPGRGGSLPPPRPFGEKGLLGGWLFFCFPKGDRAAVADEEAGLSSSSSFSSSSSHDRKRAKKDPDNTRHFEVVVGDCSIGRAPLAHLFFWGGWGGGRSRFIPQVFICFGPLNGCHLIRSGS